jgi:hypothetical protein
MVSLNLANSLPTPGYVVMLDKKRLTPLLDIASNAQGVEAIYAFSDKLNYAKFIASSPLSLTPFPLVITYLLGQVGGVSSALKLVAVNPHSPTDPLIDAVTMEAVLQALEGKLPQIPSTHVLQFDDSTATYHVAVSAGTR